MSRGDGNMNGNGFTDFLTFVSPVFVVAVFFLCLFRFLFRCCSCDNNSGTDTENETPARAIAPTDDEISATTIGGHRTTALLVRSPRFQPTDYYYGHGLPFMTVDSIMDGSLLEEPFPPKYEDALKMPAPTPRSSIQLTARGDATATVNNLAQPPPLYENAAPNVVAATGAAEAASTEQPPAYSISTICRPEIMPMPTTIPLISAAAPPPTIVRAPLSLPPESLRILIARRRLSSLDSTTLATQQQARYREDIHTSINMVPMPEFDAERPSSSFSSCSADRSVQLAAMESSSAEDISSKGVEEDPSLLRSPAKVHTTLGKTLSAGSVCLEESGSPTKRPNRLMTASLSTFVPKGTAQRRRSQSSLAEEKPRPQTANALSTMIQMPSEDGGLTIDLEKKSESASRKPSLQSVEEQHEEERPSSSCMFRRLSVEDLEKKEEI